VCTKPEHVRSTNARSLKSPIPRNSLTALGFDVYFHKRGMVCENALSSLQAGDHQSPAEKPAPLGVGRKGGFYFESSSDRCCIRYLATIYCA
jgi:hypothetical protein